MNGGLAFEGAGVVSDLAHVLAVAHGEQRAAEKGEREGGEIVEGRRGEHCWTPCADQNRRDVVNEADIRCRHSHPLACEQAVWRSLQNLLSEVHRGEIASAEQPSRAVLRRVICDSKILDCRMWTQAFGPVCVVNRRHDGVMCQSRSTWSYLIVRVIENVKSVIFDLSIFLYPIKTPSYF